MRHSLTCTLPQRPCLRSSPPARPRNRLKVAIVCQQEPGDFLGSSAHARPWLKPNTKAEAKKKAKLDPKDYTKDKDCVGCHVDGWARKAATPLTTPTNSPPG